MDEAKSFFKEIFGKRAAGKRKRRRRKLITEQKQ